MPPEPKLTEVWFPVPPKVKPGATPGAAPSDAIVLFDGKSLDAWKSANTGAAAGWKIDNGEMVVGPGTGDIQTKDVFGDVQLHVEWRDPQLPPDKVNQDRGNSGIFLQDVYEVQVLDNFENPTYVNGMVGSIYKQYPPLVNATLARRNLEHLRHHLHRAAFRGGRFADVTGATHRAAQRRAGAEQCRAQGRHHVHRRA